MHVQCIFIYSVYTRILCIHIPVMSKPINVCSMDTLLHGKETTHPLPRGTHEGTTMVTRVHLTVSPLLPTITQAPTVVP